MIKNIMVLASFLCVALSIHTNAQEQLLAYQSFEGTDAETINYSIDPETYNTSGDIWAIVDALDSITPSNGTYFWGMQDLENDNGGGAFAHTLTTTPFNLTNYEDVRISVDYSVIGFDAAYNDTLAFFVKDGAGNLLHFESIVSSSFEGPFTTEGWQTFEYTVDNSVSEISLELQARQNGGSDFAALDNIQFFGTVKGSGGEEPKIGKVILSLSDRYVYEGSETKGEIEITAKVDSALNYSATVDVAVTSPTATESDYSLSSTQITIPAGSLTATVILEATDDSEAEAPEALSISFTNLSDNLVEGHTTSAELVLYSNDISAPTTEVHSELSGGDLIAKLIEDYSVTNSQSYTDIQEEMYAQDGIDNTGGTITGIYSGWSISHSGLSEFNDQDFDTDHVWPVSLYPETSGIYSDAHQLFPARSAIITAKTDLTYNEVIDTDVAFWWVDDQSFAGGTYYPLTYLVDYSEEGDTDFEPRDAYKGDIARALFYVYTIYSEDSDFNTEANIAYFQEIKDLLREWNQIDPVDSLELARSSAISANQGNENPFVLDPTLVDRAFYMGDGGNVLPFYTIGGDATGETLLTYIQDNFEVTNPRGYNGIRDIMYATNGIDNVDGVVVGIYTGYTATGVDGRTEAYNKNINTEHTWPQGHFDSAEPMRGDAHHLFPSLIAANSDRGNNPFAEIPDNQTAKWWINGGSTTTMPSVDVIDGYSESTSSAFEPRESVKGNIARAIFYMWGLYQNNAKFSDDESFFDGMKNTLYSWHYNDPVDDAEWNRSLAIEAAQGNINPFVQDSSLVRRAFFAENGGSTPTDTTGTDSTTCNSDFLLSKTFDNDVNATDCGWTEVALQGENRWTIKSYEGDTYGEIRAYNGSGAEEVENWFISPEINFDTLEAEVLTFRSLTAYNTGDMKIRVFWTTATIDTNNLNMDDWTELEPTLDPFRGEGYGSFTESGDLDLSMATGTGYIAFYYHNTDGSTTTWQIDDIKIDGTPPLIANEDEWFSERPNQIELYQNYPNPFNPATNITFSLPQSQNVTLEVFDINGRYITTLVDGFTQEGQHEVTFDAGNLASGLYLYRLTAGKEIFISKMTLLK